MKTNDEEKHSNKSESAPRDKFVSSNQNNDQERRIFSSQSGDQSSNDPDKKRRPRVRVGGDNRPYSSDSRDRRPGPTRPSYPSSDRYSSSDRAERSDRYPSSDRSERSDRYSSSDRPQRSNSFSSSSDRPQRSNSFSSSSDRPQRSDRYPSNRNNQQSAHSPRERGGFHQGSAPRKTIKPLQKKEVFKQVKYKENADPTAPIRLNKYLANAGVCSRREADEFITAGAVKVNGVVVNELGTKITRADNVTFHDKPIQLESKVYVLLNKPKGFVTTTDDPENRKTVMDLVKSACSERIYPVGRLDRGTTGVLLLTNDGDLASKLTHPKYEKRKIYHVWLDKPVTMEDMQTIADGIELEDGEVHVDAISYVAEDDLTQIGIEIHSGKNRIVRRIFEKFGYNTLKLDRVYFAGLTKKNLSRGRWRYLTEKEVNMLRMGAFD